MSCSAVKLEFKTTEEKKNKKSINRGKDHYMYAPELSIVVIHWITLDKPVWFITPLLEIIAHLMIAFGISLQSSFHNILKYMRPTMKRLQNEKKKKTDPWLAYQQCLSLQGPVVVQHHRDPVVEKNTYIWPALYIWSLSEVCLQHHNVIGVLACLN